MSQWRTLPLRFPSDTVLRDRCASWTVVYHVMRADLFERARRYSFLITLGFTIFAAYVYLPPKEADYLTLGLDNYRGVYNSAWVGGAMAVLSMYWIGTAILLGLAVLGRRRQAQV